MLRLIAVLGLIAAGAAASVFKGPFWSLITYLWLAYFRPEKWVWDPIVAELGASFYFGLFTVVGAFLWRERFFVSPRVLLLYGVVVHSLVSTLISPHYAWSWAFWTDFIKIVTIAYMIAVFANDAWRLRMVFLTIVISLALDGAKQGWVFFLTRPGTENINEHMMFGDNNAVGTAMLMVLPLIVALSQSTTRRWEKIGYQLMIVGVLYRALITYSRGAFVTAAVVAICYLLRSRYRVRSIIAMLIVGSLVLPVLPDHYWERMETITAPEEGEREQSSRGRLYFWRVAVVMANANPFLGVGHNAYNLAYDTYKPPSEDEDFGENRAVHSQWFGILADLGYPGLLMYLALYALTIFGAERVRRRGKRDPAAAPFVPYAIGVEIAMIASAVGGSFLTFQYVEMIWHLFAIGLAVERLALAEQATTIEKEGAVAVSLAPGPLPAIQPVTAGAATRRLESSRRRQPESVLKPS